MAAAEAFRLDTENLVMNLTSFNALVKKITDAKYKKYSTN